MTDPGDPVALSGECVRACKTDDAETADATLDRLASLDPGRLLATLEDDDARKAFWINVYNAAVNHRLTGDPSEFDSRRSFFGSEWITIAGRELSPNEVEHGILRKRQSNLGMGYVRTPRFLVDRFVRRAAVDELDPRIHFALNCGAASCPPIASYTAKGIDEELDLAAESYLGTDVEYDPDAGRATVPRLLLWYRGDFGGRAGIYRLLEEYGPVPEGARPSVSYRSYDWSLNLGNFRDDPADPPRP